MLLSKIENILPNKCINLDVIEMQETVRVLEKQWSADGDPDDFVAEFRMWKRNWLNQTKKSKTFLDALNCCDAQIFKTVHRCLKIGATIPISVASSERSFSSLRRLKTYLRNKTGEARLNGMALLNIHRDIDVTEEKILNVMAQNKTSFTYVTMKECVERVNRGIRIFVPCCFSAVIYRFILPIIYNDRSLPLPCWYPVDYKAPIIFQIVYFFQILAQLQISAAFTVSSVYFISLCFLLSGQFDVLNCSLKNIVATSYIYMGASKHELIELRDNERIPGEEINEFFVAKELPFDLDCLPHLLNPADTTRTHSFREAFNYALGSCVKQHNFILNALLKLERLYNLLWLFKTLDVTLSICMGTFDVVKSTDEKSFLQLLSLGQYLFLGLWEIFMICYAGEIIYVNSQRCDEALLRSPWHLHLREVRGEFLLFLMNAQRAFKLTGGKFYPLTLEKFRGIVSTSFSFYTLLQNMDERN